MPGPHRTRCGRSPITLNLGSHFLEKSGIREEEWVQQRHHLDTQNIHLVTSSHFEHNHIAYDGDPIQTACEFQRQIINGHLINIGNNYEGRAIVHSHDWMAGGANAAIRPVTINSAAAYLTQYAYRYLPVEMLHDVNIPVYGRTSIMPGTQAATVSNTSHRD